MSGRASAFSQEDVERAVVLLQQNHPELFARLVRSEVENRPALREGGGPLIRAVKAEGFNFGQLDDIWFIVDDQYPHRAFSSSIV